MKTVKLNLPAIIWEYQENYGGLKFQNGDIIYIFDKLGYPNNAHNELTLKCKFNGNACMLEIRPHYKIYSFL